MFMTKYYDWPPTEWQANALASPWGVDNIVSLKWEAIPQGKKMLFKTNESNSLWAEYSVP